MKRILAISLGIILPVILYLSLPDKGAKACVEYAIVRQITDCGKSNVASRYSHEPDWCDVILDSGNKIRILPHFATIGMRVCSKEVGQ